MPPTIRFMDIRKDGSFTATMVMYCYLPFYIFCGEFLLSAQLRRANVDASAGTLEDLKRIVSSDSARNGRRCRFWFEEIPDFAETRIMAWCERHGVDYVLGLAKNDLLKGEIAEELKTAERKFQKTGETARILQRFPVQDHGKLEPQAAGRRQSRAFDRRASNPRFVVTSLSARQMGARYIYERTYCARGDMENRVKEQQLGLFADRTSTATMRGNQLRLYFSSMAYILMQTLRRLGLQGTALESAQCTTIRLKLLKIGAQIHVTVRRVWFRMAGGYPYADVFAHIYAEIFKKSS